MHPSLRTFLDLLKRENQIIEVKTEVDPYLEIAEIHRRVIEQGGPALLFSRVRGSRYPVVTNMFGTDRRIDLAFGPKPEALVRDLVHIAESILPLKTAELWRHKSTALELLKLGTKNTSRSPVTQVVDTPARLDQLPVLTTWQEDGGPFITLPLVYTENPLTKKHNLGIYRIQIFDSNTTGLHWQIQKGGGFHYREAERVGQDLPVTIFLGGPPALILAAIAPLPEDVPELVLASLLAGEKLKARSVITMAIIHCVMTILCSTLTLCFIGVTPSILPRSSVSHARKISLLAITCKSCFRPCFQW